MRTPVKDFHGKILGYIDEDERGNKIVRDFYFHILGKYDKANNVTRDFYGKILAKGDQSSMLFTLK